jgi:plasmid stabilization system protein ParE
MSGWIASDQNPSSPHREPSRPVPIKAARRKSKRRTLVLAEAAIDDLEQIYRWYSQPGAGAVAARRIRAIRSAVRGVVDHPCRYRRGQHVGTRELTIQGHVVVYEVRPDTGEDATAGDIFVVRVFGSGQSRDRL